MYDSCSSDRVSCDLSPSGPSGDSSESVITGESGNCGDDDGNDFGDKTGCKVGDGPGPVASDRSGNGTFLCLRRLSVPSCGEGMALDWINEGNGGEVGDISGSALTGEEDAGCRVGDGRGPGLGPGDEVGTSAGGSDWFGINGDLSSECLLERLPEPASGEGNGGAVGEIPGSALTGEGEEDTGWRDGDEPGPGKEVGASAGESNWCNDGTLTRDCFPARPPELAWGEGGAPTWINEGNNDDKVGYFFISGTVPGSRVEDGPGEGECTDGSSVFARVETMENMNMKSSLW